MTAVLAYFAVAAGGAASALAGWHAPVSISSRASIPDDPKVAVDARGDAIAVWDQLVRSRTSSPGFRKLRFLVLAAFRPAGGGWQQPVRLATAAGLSITLGPEYAADYTPLPSVAVNPRGDAIVAWRDASFNAGIFSGRIRAAVRPAGGAWRTPAVLTSNVPEPRLSEPRPQIALDPRGETIVAWVHQSIGAVIQAAFAPALGVWRAPVAISGDDLGYDPQVAIDPQGNAIAVWVHEPIGGHHTVIQAAFRPTGGAWRKPHTLSRTRGYAREPQVAFDQHGNAIAVWTTSGVSGVRGDLIQAAFKPAHATWRKPVSVSRAALGGASRPQIALDRAGDAIAVWYHSAAHPSIQAAEKPARRTWQRPVKIASIRTIATPELAIDTLGNALVIWGERGSVVRATRRPAHGVWKKPVTVATGTCPKPLRAELCAPQPNADLDSLGNAVAVWKTPNWAGSTVKAATFTPTS